MHSGNEPVWNKVKAVAGAPEPTGRALVLRRPGPPPPAAKGIPYWQLARSHKFLIAGFIMLGAIAGTIAVTLKAPLYQAGTTVVFNQGSTGMNQGNSQGGGSAPSILASTIQTQIAILTSRTLINRAFQRMNLELTPQLSAPATVFTRLRNRIPFLQQDPLLQSREAVGIAASTVSAKPVVGTQIIQIQCSSPSPEVAASFVNTLANAYQSLTQASNSSQTQERSQWIESQLDESKVRLQQANESLRIFVQKSGMNFLLAQTNLEDSKAGSLRVDVATIQAIRIQKQSLLELAKSTSPENLPDVMNDTTLLSLKGAINEQRRQMAQLLTTLTPEEPKVKKVQVQIDELEKNLQQAEASLLRRLQSDYEEALSQQQKLTTAYNAQTHSASAQADKSAEYTMLSREVDTDQQLYNNLMAQSGQAALMALAPSGSIQIIDLAYPGSVPSSPKPKTEIPEWAVAGGLLGYGLLLLRELVRRKRLDKRFDGPGYTQTVLGVPELGVIPSTQITKSARRMFFGVSGRRTQPGEVADNPDLAAENGHMALGASVTGNGDRSAMLSESFRQTLVSLLRTKPRGHNPVYVITSAGPGEGKTTFSANLARAMAEIGQRVLLVDADLRRPHVHSLLGLGDHPGLSDILAGPVEVGNLELDRFIQPTNIDDLSVMTHGQARSETSLFFSPRVGELVTLLQSRFDCVLFDTAPALPFPDARLWGMHADGVVLIVRAGVTTRVGAAAACERFLNDGIPVLGTILNDWKPDSDSELPYYYKSYQSAGPR